MIGAVRACWCGAGCARRSARATCSAAYLAFGITAMFGLQALVNIGVVLGSLPTKGLPLPFISYGGTSLVMSLFAAGMLANISARNPEPRRLGVPGRARGARSRAPTAASTPGPRIIVEVGRPAAPARARRRRPIARSMAERATAARAHRGRRHRRPPLSRASRSPRRCGARRAARCVFVGTARGLETRLVPAAGFPLELRRGERPQAHGRWAACCAGWRACRARSSSRARILRRHRPDVVLGVGGYASGPLVFAAALLGYPTAIQEQNSRPRLHQPRARAVRRGACSSRSTTRPRRFARRKVRFARQPGAPRVPRPRRRRRAGATPTARRRS